ncbi:hypothetical protein [Natronobacterium gregoryi]|uniref:Uncharacterized protein n=2 Tax=Natronobacterium gregoryi TaxID=44930 RepID=L0AIU4_NATGS|nr:hypothetical protein [Natronobacterium gregoryi]AFZ72985.1 hypothetical protein Natgr_1792 [Natronobacterium gregoryi SP2]ELY70083.1 hypothetical protein C490_06954 [Natronobacterium gregoryi SP2]PLK19089.1 hypothetical protein CYV19_16780 [Natronobacterium gregoryi SP2]SFJ62225.1 hypothetical protein SAMN05443661_1484 [Natronobacterium gregoryi]
MVELYRSRLFADTRTCYRFLQAGFGVILVTFFAGMAVLAVPEYGAVYDVLVMPSLFVGLGLLLFGIGTHLHAMHLNVVRMHADDTDDK